MSGSRLQPISSELGQADSTGLSFSNLVLRTLAATLSMTSSVTATYAACGMGIARRR